MMPNNVRKRSLVPFIDIINHSFDSKTHHQYNSSTKSLEIVCNDEVKSGSQLFMNYGPMGNTKLLHFSGFTIDNNPHDYMELYLHISPEAPLYYEKTVVLQSQGINCTNPFYLRYVSKLDTSSRSASRKLKSRSLPMSWRQFAFNVVTKANLRI